MQVQDTASSLPPPARQPRNPRAGALPPAEPALTPLGRQIYQILVAAEGKPVPCLDLIAGIHGTREVHRLRTFTRHVATIRMALKPLARQSIRGSGRNQDLAYALVDAPDAGTLSDEEIVRRLDVELMRLRGRGMSATRIAATLGLPGRDAVLGRLTLLRNVPPDSAAVAASRESDAPQRPRTVLDGVTLPPCGYDAWSVRPDGTHVVKRPEEDRPRVLTHADRVHRQMTTETAPFAARIQPDGEA